MVCGPQWWDWGAMVDSGPVGRLGRVGSVLLAQSALEGFGPVPVPVSSPVLQDCSGVPSRMSCSRRPGLGAACLVAPRSWHEAAPVCGGKGF